MVLNCIRPKVSIVTEVKDWEMKVSFWLSDLMN